MVAIPAMAYVPAKTAARMLEVTVQRVYQLCASGSLGSIRVDGFLMVRVQSVNARISAMEDRRDGGGSRR